MEINLDGIKEMCDETMGVCAHKTFEILEAMLKLETFAPFAKDLKAILKEVSRINLLRHDVVASVKRIRQTLDPDGPLFPVPDEYEVED